MTCDMTHDMTCDMTHDMTYDMTPTPTQSGFFHVLMKFGIKNMLKLITVHNLITAISTLIK